MLPLRIALRFLWSSKGQTILIALGIAVGVSVQVFIGSLIQGLQKDLVDSTIGNRSQITITREDDSEYIDNYASIKENINALDTDVSVVSYALDQPGTMINGNESSPVLMRAFSFSLANQIYGWEDAVIEGKLPSNQNEIVVGSPLMEELDVSVGDTVTLEVPLIGTQEVTISGVYAFDVTAIDESWVAMTLPTLQSILNEGDVVSAIEMQVDDVFMADTTAETINQNIASDNLVITNWKDENADLLSGLEGQSVSSIMIQVFVTLSVVLGISSVLAITVLQKSRQLGILKAMGIKNRTASFIFLCEGMILGVLGAIGGIGLGLGLSVAFTQFAVRPDGTPVVNLYIDPQFILLSGFIALTAATLASLFPALRSRNISIIEVIKNG